MHHEAQGKVSDEFKIPPERCSWYCLTIKGAFGFTGLVVGVHMGFKDDENEQRKGAIVAAILS
jgi:hypothetical protein